jgi:hypothetical protein
MFDTALPEALMELRGSSELEAPAPVIAAIRRPVGWTLFH